MSGRKAAAATPEWALYTDWCTARAIAALPTTVEAVIQFLTEVGGSDWSKRRRIQVIRRVHSDVGQKFEWPTTGERPHPWRHGPGWLTLTEALSDIPKAGWPIGFRGRRDGFLLVLAGQLRLQREEIRSVTKDQVQRHGDQWLIQGEEISTDDDPLKCPSCAVSRWLRCLGWAANGDRGEARKALMRLRRSDIEQHHDCADPVSDRWRDTWQLLPPIDPHGWMDEYAAISTRAISGIITLRQTRWPLPQAEEGRGLDDDAPDPFAVPARHTSERDDMDIDDLLDLLDEKADAAAERLKRFEQELHEHGI